MTQNTESPTTPSDEDDVKVTTDQLTDEPSPIDSPAVDDDVDDDKVSDVPEDTDDNPPASKASLTAPPPTPEPAPSSPPTSPKKSNKWLKVLILVLIVIIIGAIVAYLVHKHNQNQSSSVGIKTVQHITLGIEQADLGTTFYPNAEEFAGSSLMYSQIFDGLVQYENQNQIVPDLASGWTTPNDTTWIFTIKGGIKFHDGNTLKPADVVYSLNLLKKMAADNDEYAQGFADTLKSVQTVGSNQVKVVTTQPDPVLLNKLAFLYIVDPNLPKGENPTMAGTGAYEMKPGTKLTDTNVQLVAFNDFHGGQVLTKSLTIDDVKNYSQLISGFKNHQYNIIGQVPLKDDKLPNSYSFTEQDDTVNFLALNTTSGPLSNKLVREAIRYAINPLEIAKQGSDEKVTPISQLIPPSIPGYNPSITPYKQNITKAKQLLAQAGYSKGLTLTLSNTFNNPIDQPTINELKQVGITLNLKIYSSLNDLLTAYLNGQGQMTYLAYASNTLDGADVLGSTLIPAYYSNSKFYALVNQATTTIDPATRLKLLQQAETIVDQDVPVIPVYYSDNIYLMDKPYVLHQDLPAIYASVYFSKVHLKG